MKNFFIILIFLTIFYFMGLQTWSGLQKSATDDETIEQAIARLIAVHEGDSTAHLGVGESLEAHKTADVLDHPQQSVVGDKLTAGQINISTSFDSLDTWGQAGDIDPSFPSLLLSTDRGTTNFTILYTTFSYLIDWGLFDFECLFTETAKFEWDDTSHLMSIGFFENGISPSAYNSVGGFFFEVDAGDLWAVVKIGSNRNRVQLSSIDPTVLHTYRGHFVPADNKVYFYVDGVLVASITPPSGTWSGTFSYLHQNAILSGASAGEQTFLYISNLSISLNHF